LHFKRALPLQTAYVFTSLAAMRSVKCVLGSPGVAAGVRALCYKIQMTVNCLTVLLTEGQISCLIPVEDGVVAVFNHTAAEQHDIAVAAAHDSSSCSSSSSSGYGLSGVCNWRSSEEVLFFWLVTFGLLLPLYIMYVRELSYKQRFLRALLCQQQQRQQQRQQRQQPQQMPATDAGVDPAAHTHHQRQQQQLDRQLAVVAGRTDRAFVGGVLQIGPLLHCAAVCMLLMLGSVIVELLLLVLRPPACVA
jgi:heme exporter protein D